jgi:hypothetical protein
VSSLGLDMASAGPALRFSRHTFCYLSLSPTVFSACFRLLSFIQIRSVLKMSIKHHQLHQLSFAKKGEVAPTS